MGDMAELEQLLRLFRADPSNASTIVKLLFLAARLGISLDELLERMGITFEKLIELLGPETAEAKAIARLFRLLAAWRKNPAFAKRLVEIINDLKAAMEKFPSLRPIWDEIVKRGTQSLSFAGPIGIGLAEVLLFFAVGLLLPASRMGELTLSDDKDRDEWYELLVTLFIKHRKDRDDFRAGHPTKTRTQLLEDADYLWRLVQAFLTRYPDDERAGQLKVIEKASGGWVRKYLGYDDDDLNPDPPAMKPPPPVTPPPVTPKPVEHPHTVTRPAPFDDSIIQQHQADVDTLRKRILEIRARIRELKKKYDDPSYNFEGTRNTIHKAIDELLEELARLRATLERMGEDSGEEFDEPFEVPPPPQLPDWPLGHNWAHPARLYVNPETGKQHFFSDPPDGWEPFYGPDGEPRFHWGWKPDVDPRTGKIVWKPGWVLNSGLANQSPRLVPSDYWSQLREAQRDGVDVAAIAHRHGINWTLPLESQPEGVITSDGLRAAALEASAARADRRGTVGWGGYLPWPTTSLLHDAPIGVAPKPGGLA